MKVTWEPTDVQAGVVVGRSKRVERWIIGYDPRAPGLTKWALISLKDGMISQSGLTRQQLADHLNVSYELPVELFHLLKRAEENE